MFDHWENEKTSKCDEWIKLNKLFGDDCQYCYNHVIICVVACTNSVAWRDVMSCCVVSCCVVSCHVMSCHVKSNPRHATSRHVTSRHVTSCHVMSCHVMYVMSCHVIQSHSMSFRLKYCITDRRYSWLSFRSSYCHGTSGAMSPVNGCTGQRSGRRTVRSRRCTEAEGPGSRQLHDNIQQHSTTFNNIQQHSTIKR